MHIFVEWGQCWVCKAKAVGFWTERAVGSWVGGGDHVGLGRLGRSHGELDMVAGSHR